MTEDDGRGNAHSPQNKLGYERLIEDSGLEASAIKQRAALNINESATPIHLSQGSILGDNTLDL